MNKKKLLISSAVLSLCLASSASAYYLGHQQGQDEARSNQVSYVDASGKDSKVVTNTKGMTPDEVSAKEGISAEQIVIKITDDGYVTAHGDHFHYYTGKVPYDAILSEELIMKDPNYVFKQSDVINEVKDGYIIKVEGKYYLYLKEGSKSENIRSKAEVAEQQARASKKSGHRENGGTLSSVSTSGRYTTDDGYVFSPTDVIDDLGDAFIVPHGDHFHYIPKADLSASELAAAQEYWDKKVGKGNPVRPPYANAQGQMNQSIHYRPADPDGTPNLIQSGTNSANQAVQPGETLAGLLAQLDRTPLSERHVEVDGLVYDPRTITRFSSIGVAVPHGNHYHFIPYSSMSALELKITKLLAAGHPIDDKPIVAPTQPSQPNLNQPIQPIVKSSKPEKPIVKPAKPNVPTPPSPDKPKDDHGVTPLNERKGKPNSQIVYSPEEIAKAKAAGKYTTSDGYIFDAKDIIDDMGDAYLTPHMGHTHWIPKKDLSAEELAAAEAFWKAKKGAQSEVPTVPETLDNPSDGSRKKSTPEIYETVEAAKIVPVDKIPYSADQAVVYRNGRLIIPHHDHYHNLDLSWFDESPAIYEAPEGYTIEELMATIKYYIENPSERPLKEGWGSDSGHNQSGNKEDNNYDIDEEPEEDAEDEVDDHILKMQKLAKQYHMDQKEFDKRVGTLCFRYWASEENFEFINETEVRITKSDGTIVLVNLHTMEEVVTEPSDSATSESSVADSVITQAEESLE
ncbi:pneumococcal-type histidine triad protein [Streptococcus merionis]|uniref:pneumococcal-type histidine triad protein n=1 Tax=Streptococcus merionis TaxID=400065 RepID=UPI0026E9B947|nr:pneumococcal-type histidine triad protein [Streptococcus merionis]